MPTHYLKLLPFLARYAEIAGATTSSWVTEIVDDITHNGSYILVQRLPPLSDRPRIGLTGSAFYVEAGRDRDREDVLFISRVERAHTGKGQSALRYDSDFRLVVNNQTPSMQLDSTAQLFSPVVEPKPEQPAPQHTTLSAPGPKLLMLLRNCSPAIRKLFRPGGSVPAMPITSLISLFRGPWLRHRLETCAPIGVDPRTMAILAGTVNPIDLSEGEMQAIASVFGIALLNRFLASRADWTDDGLALLEDMGSLPLIPQVRATVWSSSLRALPDSDLRRELHAATHGLLAAAQNQDTKFAFETALLRSLTSMHDAGNAAPVVGEILDIAGANPDNTLEAIAQWAARLEVRDEALGSAGNSKDIPSNPENLEQKAKPDVQDSACPSTPSSIAFPPEFDRWVLSLRLPNLDVLSVTQREIVDEVERLRAALDEPIRIAWVVKLSNRLSTLADRVQRWKKLLPSPDAIVADETEAREVYEFARQHIGSEVNDIISPSIRPDLLKEMVAIMEYRRELESLPMWGWCRQDCMPSILEAPDLFLWRRLLDPVVRRRALLTTQLLKEFSDLEPDTLGTMVSPSVGVSIDEHIEEQLRESARWRLRLRDIDTRHAIWVASAIRRGTPLEQVIRCAEILDGIRPRLSEITFGEILRAHETQTESTDSLVDRDMALDRAVRETEKLFGSADDVTVKQLDNLIARNHKAKPLLPLETKLTVQHNFIDKTAQRSHLQIASVSAQPYGLFLAPLVIESAAAIDIALRFEWTVVGPWRDAWPSDWPGVEPSELRIGKLDWRPHADKPHLFLYGFKVVIPVRKLEPPMFPKRLSLRVAAISLDGLDPLATRDLEWNQLSATPVVVRLDWPDTLNPRFVKQHPIGPQRDADDMTERLRAGHSFAVVAPRRFGKSTLVGYLGSLNKQYNLVVADPIVCTRFAGASGIEPAELWKEVSEMVRLQTGTPVDLYLENSLPRAAAFDSARRAVAQAGGKTLVILFDEAQALFRRGPAGYHLGDRLKDSIEHYWSASDEVMAGVAFVFVGLPGIIDRAGSNLIGALRPFQRNDIDEDDLNRLLLEVTNGGLQTTRGARLRIAQLSKNLLILRELLERLVSLVRKEGRSWVSSDDVTLVELDLVRKLREGQEPAINRSLRDTFNDAETVNEWQPSPLYPVAVAIAEARSEGLRLEPDLQQRVAEILTTWASMAEADYLKRITFEPDRIREGFKALREAGVIKDNEVAFVSPLLDAWLLGVSRQGLQADEAFYPAMLSSAVARVRRPPTLTPVDEGGQARVFKFTHGEEILAYRESTIGSDEDRVRFVETTDALKEVMKRIVRRLPGTEYVYDLRTVGLRDDDDCVAVQIYRWIDGDDLSTRVAQLPALAVAELGYQLVQAIAWLHSIGVIHRDVQPKNAILSDETMRPILIDFGLARLEGRVLQSAMASEFAAPEVRAIKPNWTKAADIWSLGMTLERLMRKEDRDSGLAKLISQAHAHDMAARPPADALVEEFKANAANLAVQQRKDEFFDEQVSHVAKEDASLIFYQNLIRKFRPKFEATHLGLFPTNATRAAEAADFLNQVVEGWAYQNRYGNESLGTLKRDNNLTQRKLEWLSCISVG